MSQADFERQLNDFDPEIRQHALKMLLEMADSGAIVLPPQTSIFNLHCHSFCSYNGYGLSPTALAWKGRCEGLYAMALVDFDVLDGMTEFLAACRAVGMRCYAGMETRVFVPEFSTRIINSPGEPGISYHMGIGFVPGAIQEKPLLDDLLRIASGRTKSMVERINPVLDPVSLDFEADVLPLTPGGNATERHVCAAYDAKGQQIFPDTSERAAFWSEKLGVFLDQIAGCLEDGPTFQGLIRAKTMKAGGAGYVKPEAGDFPSAAQVNAFSLANGAIPTFAFLDGSTEGEEAMDELLDVMMASGVAAVNIIPDRNWNFSDPDVKATKVAAFHAFVENAKGRDLPIVIGTEMNAYGQRFVDDFSAPEMAKYHDTFLEGCHILHAHTLLQEKACMGYVSAWAEKTFANTAAKNAFFRTVGERFDGPEALSATDLAEAQSLADVSVALNL